jgi:glutathione peroxidase
MKRLFFIAVSIMNVVVSVGVIASPSSADHRACPAWLDHDFRQLHSSNIINLCEHVGNQAILLVNTASHCGFTHQFASLETLHQAYQQKGLVVVGFSSHDFNQEAATETKTADVCYVNYGVQFTMMAPIAVKGEAAHPLFKVLAKKSAPPGWNFNKFLISRDRQEIQHFNVTVSPDSRVLRKAVEQVL